MLRQYTKATFLFATSLFIIMAVVEYFGWAKAYPALMSVAFIIHFAGCLVDFWYEWQSDRRKFDWGIDQREYDRLMIRQAD